MSKRVGVEELQDNLNTCDLFCEVLKDLHKGKGGKGQTLNVSLTNITSEYLYEALRQYFPLLTPSGLKHFVVF